MMRIENSICLKIINFAHHFKLQFTRTQEEKWKKPSETDMKRSYVGRGLIKRKREKPLERAGDQIGGA